MATGTFLSSMSTGRENGRTREVPWLAEVQRPPQPLPQPQDLNPLLPAGAVLSDWLGRRNQVRSRWLDFLGQIKHSGHTPTTKLIREERIGDVVRQLVRYESEPGWPTEAYILQPAVTNSRLRPGVVVFHSTVPHSIRQPAGVEGNEKAFGLKLAERGFVTLCPRNFLWPENHRIDTDRQTELFRSGHPHAKGMAKMLWDAQVAVDLLISLPGVDRDRIGAVGHSLGAKEVLYLAALDERIRAAVSSEGGIGTQFSNWDAPWYLDREIKAFATSHEHHELLALAAPRPFLLIGGDSADGDRSWPFVEAALAIYRLYGDMPRVGLFNHKQGHSVPPIAEQRIYSWLETYLAQN